LEIIGAGSKLDWNARDLFARQSLGKTHCLNFFKRLDNNFCVNMAPKKGMWCYVSPECQELNGGKKVNEQVSYKVCNASQDQMMWKVPTRELVVIAAQRKLNTGFLFSQTAAVSKNYWEDLGKGEDHIKGTPDYLLPAMKLWNMRKSAQERLSEKDDKS